MIEQVNGGRDITGFIDKVEFYDHELLKAAFSAIRVVIQLEGFSFESTKPNSKNGSIFNEYTSVILRVGDIRYSVDVSRSPASTNERTVELSMLCGDVALPHPELDLGFDLHFRGEETDNKNGEYRFELSKLSSRDRMNLDERGVTRKEARDFLNAILVSTVDLEATDSLFNLIKNQPRHYKNVRWNNQKINSTKSYTTTD